MRVPIAAFGAARTSMPSTNRAFARYALIVAAVVSIAALSYGCHGGPGAVSATLPLHRCISWSTRELARCGTFVVPENRAIPGGKTIRLRVMLLAARDGGLASSHDAAPLVFFNGGPGVSTVDYADYASWALDGLRATHALLLVDMRGTGGPDALACDLYSDGGRIAPYLRPMFPIERVRDCAQRLSPRADLTQYTTIAAADDFDAVRAALGFEQVLLFGASYGSRLALEYMRRHGTHVRRAVLLGVVPPEMPAGGEFARGTERALAGAIASCASSPSCRAEAPDPRGDIATLVARARRSPIVVRLWNWKRVSTEKVTLGAQSIAELLWGESYSPEGLRNRLPLVHRAVVSGDYKTLIERLRGSGRARRSNRREGLMLSVLCSEDIWRLSAADWRGGDTMLGAPVVEDLVEACGAWPRATVPPEFYGRVASDIPTLLISGGLDPVSPSDMADSAALGLSRSEHYVDPARGHAELDDATRARIVSFLSAPPTDRAGR